MKGGHNRKTVAEHLNSGTFRRHRHGDRAAAAEALAPKRPPTCPRELTGDARRMFRLLAKELAGAVGVTDGPALALLCVTHVELMRGALKLAGLAPGGEEHARLARSLRGQHETFAKLASLFGLTPVDRERLPVPQTGKTNTGAVTW